jgi:hypothetical protein
MPPEDTTSATHVKRQSLRSRFALDNGCAMAQPLRDRARERCWP